jgi:hypothetical protein
MTSQARYFAVENAVFTEVDGKIQISGDTITLNPCEYFLRTPGAKKNVEPVVIMNTPDVDIVVMSVKKVDRANRLAQWAIIVKRFKNKNDDATMIALMDLYV